MAYHRWTPAECARLVALRRRGLSTEACAAALGLETGQVRDKWCKINWRLRRGRADHALELERLRAALRLIVRTDAKNGPCAQIAARALELP